MNSIQQKNSRSSTILSLSLFLKMSQGIRGKKVERRKETRKMKEGERRRKEDEVMEEKVDSPFRHRMPSFIPSK